MFKYNKTQNFYSVARNIKNNCEFHGRELPVIRFRGTIKAHGTNAGVVFSKGLSKYTIQSRERVLTRESDNFGFADFVETTPGVLDELREIAKSVSTQETEKIAIFGEWMGPGIQNGVGIANLPEKIFMIFAINVGSAEEPVFIREVQNPKHPRLKSSIEFGVHDLVIDFAKLEEAQAVLTRLTDEVEEKCPITERLLGGTNGNTTGEGLVWHAVEEIGSSYFNMNELFFKTKGEKFSVTKTKEKIPVDPELVRSVEEFVQFSVTENRLRQGLGFIKEMGLQVSHENTAEFIRWVVKDVLSEESETLTASGLTEKDVKKRISVKAREFWFAELTRL